MSGLESTALVWGLVSTILATPAPLPSALKSLQGTWRAESVEFEGINLIHPKEKMPGSDWDYEINHDRLRVRSRTGVVLEGRVVVDARHSPKYVDLVFQRQTMRGVYAVDGTILVICLQRDGSKPRSLSFSTTKDEGTVFYILRRKPERPD